MFNEAPPGISSSPWAMWVQPFRWLIYRGVAQFHVNRPVISIEFRTAAEVHAALGAGSPALAFMASGWDSSSAFPPLDGLTDWGADRNYWDLNPSRGPTQFFRILVREDWESLPAPWNDQRFFAESLAHELGHVTMDFLEQMCGASFVRANICDMLGEDVADWNNTALPWERRPVEMAAEFFKDTVFPGRKFDSRAAKIVPEDRFDDWKLLMLSLIEEPYWSVGDTDDLHYTENSFFFNLGASSFVHQPNTKLTYLVNDEVFPLWTGFIGHDYDAVLRPPAEDTIDQPELYIAWNWDAEGTGADPGPGSRWDDIQGDTDPEPGKPVYNFSFDGFVGEPANNVRPGFTVDFFDLDTNFSHTGVYYGSWWFWLAPDPADDEDTRRSYLPPVSGRVRVDFNEVYSSTATWDTDRSTLTRVTLPAEGFTAWPRFLNSGPMPKFTMYPSEPHSFGTDAMGMSFLWPWFEYVGPRPTIPPSEAVWPEHEGPSFPGKLQLGDGNLGVVRL